MYISFNIVNEDAANPLELIGQPHVMFDRVRVRAGGAELEDIALFNRLSEQFDIYQSAELKQNKAIYGFPAQPNGAITAVAPGKQAKICMTLPLSAVFGTSQTKYLPLFAMNGGIELLMSLAAPATHLVTGSGKSSSYRLENIQMHIGLITLDSALQEKYFQSLSSGQAMLLHTKQFSHQEMFLAPSQGSFECTVTKPLSRLSTVFVSFVTELTLSEQQEGKSYVNTFSFFPDAAETCEASIMIGANRIPEFPALGISQHWMRLRQALGVSNSQAHSLGVSRDQYQSTHHIQAYDCEKVPLVSASGMNTNGAEIRLQVKGLTDASNTNMKRAYMALHYETVFEIRASGISKLD